MTLAVADSNTLGPTTSRAIVRLARAGEPDNTARCELFARVSMETDIILSVRRDPDFDALYRLQSDEWVSVVVELDGVVEGTGTIIVRDGYIEGRQCRVGYLGDLRLSPRLTGRFLLERFYGALLQEVRERYGCELFLTTVIASNEHALRALTRETLRSRRSGRPQYALVGDFDIRSLHLLLPRRAERSPYAVRRATPSDIPSLSRFLDADARSRPFGFVFSEQKFRRRLRDWPGLSIDAFYLAEDERGELGGCIALWDASAVKRMVVCAYRGPMRRARFAYDMVARLLGMPHLPTPGSAFRYKYVTHQAIPSGDPRILRALLMQAYRDARAGQGLHFLSVCAPHSSPLEPAFRGFQATNLRSRLYVVSLPDVDAACVTRAAAWPGFEMALV